MNEPKESGYYWVRFRDGELSELTYIRLPYQLGVLRREVLPGEQPRQIPTPIEHASGEK